MKTDEETFRTFEDSEVDQAARQFRKAMYAVNRRLPALEKFGLASQIRRAAVSLTNNIAEGHGRFHYLGSSPAYGLTDDELDASLA